MTQTEQTEIPAEPELDDGPVILTHGPVSAPDPDGLDKSARINLGIDLLHALRGPGKRCTVEEIAAWCDCSEEAIKHIEKKALEKLRRALRKAGVNRETLRSLVPDHSRAAVRKDRVESVG
jgi:hypothetical protein